MGSSSDDADDKRAWEEIMAGFWEWYGARAVALSELIRIDDAAIERVRTVIAANPRLTIETLTLAVETLRTVQKGELPRGIGNRPRRP